MVKSLMVGCIRVVVSAGLLWAVAHAQIASAVTVDFENPPYAAGDVVGQGGWSVAPYFPTPNGTVTVSTTSPLAGSQSLSYTRTELGLAPNGADVLKPGVAIIANDGTGAADLTASFLISSSSLSPQGLGFGVVGLNLRSSNAGSSDNPSIAIQLNNAGYAESSIEEFAGIGGFGGPAAWHYFGGALAAAFFPEHDTLEFKVDVDFDSSTYTTAYRNVTAGDVAFTNSGSVRGFAVPFPTDSNGHYSVDVIAAFRYGAGQIDDITLSGNIIPEPATLGLSLASAVALALVRRRRG
jgi:hypothetical protein